MAKATLKTDWAPTLRAAIKDAGVPRGWSVYQRNGNTRLRVRTGAGGKSCWSKDLPIAWAISNIAAITKAVAELHTFTTAGTGQSLDQAWAQLNPSSVGQDQPGISKPISGINWQALANSHFRARELHGTRIGAKSMALEHRYCGKAVELLTGSKAPTTPYKLIDATLASGGWMEKPRARQQCVDAVVRMLSHGIAHEGLSADWEIRQAEKAKLRGNGKPAKELPVMELTDVQILELIDACPTEGWQNLVLTMATYGLRPIEVAFLEVRMSPETKRKQLYCTYQKACGGRTKKLETAPRFLYPMPLRDADGQERSGDLTAAIEAGLLSFPALKCKEPGEAISQYLRRLNLWRQWQEEGKAKGVALKPYSFRNSYSVRCHERGVPSAMVAEAMGHSDKTHNENYLTSTARATAAAFSAAS